MLRSIRVGLPSGPAHQVDTLSRPVRLIPDQTILHVEHPDHSAERSGVQPVRRVADAVEQIRGQYPREPSRRLGCKFSLTFDLLARLISYRAVFSCIQRGEYIQ